MWDGFGGMGWGWIGLGILHMVLFWVLVILGIAVLVKWLASAPQAPDEHLIDVVKRRYAKGEITREQYEQLKRELAE